MRHLLLALSFALLPLATQAGEHAHDEHHADTGKHAHGVGELDVALEDSTLELELRSPAANLLGFEHAPRNAQEQARIAAVQQQLQRPPALFGNAVAACRLDRQQLDSPLFASGHAGHAQAGSHSEIHARYRFTCPSMAGLDLAGLFRQFPATGKLLVQLIGPNGQQGIELTAQRSTLRF